MKRGVSDDEAARQLLQGRYRHSGRRKFTELVAEDRGVTLRIERRGQATVWVFYGPDGRPVLWFYPSLRRWLGLCGRRIETGEMPLHSELGLPAIARRMLLGHPPRARQSAQKPKAAPAGREKRAIRKQVLISALRGTER